MKKFENYISNLSVLSTAKAEDLKNDFIISGIIDKFTIQFELSWKVLKELMRFEGKAVANTGSPREILKAAYAVYSFIDEDIFLSMLKDRNDMSHIYDGNAAIRLVEKIINSYIPAFEKLKDDIIDYYGDSINEIV